MSAQPWLASPGPTPFHLPRLGILFPSERPVFSHPDPEEITRSVLFRMPGISLRFAYGLFCFIEPCSACAAKRGPCDCVQERGIKKRNKGKGGLAPGDVRVGAVARLGRWGIDGVLAGMPGKATIGPVLENKRGCFLVRTVPNSGRNPAINAC